MFAIAIAVPAPAAPSEARRCCNVWHMRPVGNARCIDSTGIL